LDEIQAMLYAAHGVPPPSLPTPNPVPASKDHIRTTDVTLPKTVLLSLKEVEHTNRLVKGQTLPFGVDGLTIIYGDNGSGKSGYARLLKGLCRARRERVEPILGNVFESTKEPSAQAMITFRSDGTQQSVSWTDGTPPPAELCRISVFDAATAPLYADQQNRIEFLPQGLDVIPRLGAALTQLAGRIDRELDTLQQLTAPALPEAPAGSKGASLIQRLAAAAPKPLPTADEIKNQANWDQPSVQRLAAITDELKALEEPVKLAARHTRAAAIVKRLKEQIDSAEETLNACKLDTVEEVMTRLSAARAAAALAATEKFAADPFAKHVGTDPWRKLYEYARQFSVVVYPGEDFPVVGLDRYCVLCQQPLQPEAIDRFVRFKSFIEHAAQQETEKIEAERRGFEHYVTRS
jgi:energy-coupling factor transporter ATP-binding protein EcfA2